MAVFFALLFCFVSSVAVAGDDGGRPDFAEGVFVVEYQGGTGTGFVVATEPDKERFEVWTNGHVVGAVGTKLRLQHGRGTSGKKDYLATVARREYRNGVDMAKLIAIGVYNGRVFHPATGGDNGGGNNTCGHPRGGRCYALRLSPLPKFDWAEVKAYGPPSIPGQSGSPVLNEEGFVVGVVSMYFESGTRFGTLGGYLPITDWTGERRVSSRDIGPFKALPNFCGDD